MRTIRLGLLRGICQMPAYVAHARGFFAAEGLASTVDVTPTAWMIPERLLDGSLDFAVMPWTRVAAAEAGEAPLRVLCGSGCEEAAIVVRGGLDPVDVRSVAVPREGGMKDLTAQALLESLGWGDVVQRRFPSGDGAILCFVGRGADAASMVEPWATMLEVLGLGRVVRRTGDVWPGAPGCVLAASAALVAADPALCARVVRAYARAAAFVDAEPDAAAGIGAGFIGVEVAIVRRALDANRPRIEAVRNDDAIRRVLLLMQRLGYVRELHRHFADLRFLDAALAPPVAASG